ncbi:hypothetical protein BER1_1142 [plant metagenome]|uniref:Uncharacterized protein n=1 Tax=plant metagenome TaxID=1297885 RepID=A0A484Q6P3_9ZZZZ
MSTPCPPVPSLLTESWDDLAQAHIALAIQYAECRERHAAAVRAYERSQ